MEYKKNAGLKQRRMDMRDAPPSDHFTLLITKIQNLTHDICIAVKYSKLPKNVNPILPADLKKVFVRSRKYDNKCQNQSECIICRFKYTGACLAEAVCIESHATAETHILVRLNYRFREHYRSF